MAINHDLTALLDYVNQRLPAVAHDWQGWRIMPIQGGMNNRLYRVTSTTHDFALKWMIRDDRDRAGREFAALQLLEACGADFAPRAVLLDQERYRMPVVVQTWLDDTVLRPSPPICSPALPPTPCYCGSGGRSAGRAPCTRCRAGMSTLGAARSRMAGSR